MQELAPRAWAWVPSKLLKQPLWAKQAHLELAQSAVHFLRRLLEGGRGGNDLGQQRVVVAGHDISCGHCPIQPARAEQKHG